MQMNSFMLPLIMVVLLGCKTQKATVLPDQDKTILQKDSVILSQERAFVELEKKLDSTVRIFRIVQDSLNAEIFRLDTLKRVLRVVQPYLPDTQGYHIYLPVGMRNLGYGTRWVDTSKRQQYLWLNTYPIDSFVGGID